MIRSRKPAVFVAFLTFFVVLGISVSAEAADKQTLTGEVSDAMCGAGAHAGHTRRMYACLCGPWLKVCPGRGR